MRYATDHIARMHCNKLIVKGGLAVHLVLGFGSWGPGGQPRDIIHVIEIRPATGQDYRVCLCLQRCGAGFHVL